MSLLLLAFAEELFFRGYLLKLYSNLTVSLLFTLPHIILYTDIHSILTFFPSLLFGFLYERTKNLPLVSVVHFISNVMYDKLLPVLLPELLKSLLNFPLG
ncbi:MAG: CPBP family glutamic-type intramembrane protease [Hydrogenothermaceae bacterium]|nr:CPBP family glutamic-type intramembrane protease [Hydrogenothermaceae bacterium]